MLSDAASLIRFKEERRINTIPVETERRKAMSPTNTRRSESWQASVIAGLSTALVLLVGWVVTYGRDDYKNLSEKVGKHESAIDVLSTEIAHIRQDVQGLTDVSSNVSKDVQRLVGIMEEFRNEH